MEIPKTNANMKQKNNARNPEKVKQKFSFLIEGGQMILACQFIDLLFINRILWHLRQKPVVELHELAGVAGGFTAASFADWRAIFMPSLDL